MCENQTPCSSEYLTRMGFISGLLLYWSSWASIGQRGHQRGSQDKKSEMVSLRVNSFLFCFDLKTGVYVAGLLSLVSFCLFCKRNLTFHQIGALIGCVVSSIVLWLWLTVWSVWANVGDGLTDQLDPDLSKSWSAINQAWNVSWIGLGIGPDQVNPLSQGTEDTVKSAVDAFFTCESKVNN